MDRAAEIAQDVSVVVNNADIARVGSVLDPDTSSLRLELDTNLFGPLAVTSAFADRLAQRSGVVINVASIVSWIPWLAPTGCPRQPCGAPPTPCAWNSARGAYRSSGSTSRTSIPT